MIELNLKKDSPTVELAICEFNLELERAIKTGEHLIKVLHGYGSRGKGGAICVYLRRHLSNLKKQGVIIDYIPGAKWNISYIQVFNIVTKYKIYDEDLNRSNPGITIVVI